MKLPKNYVPGSGVHKATGFGGIGQRMLEKQGWQEGQGLGKEQTGMTEALKAKEKKDSAGIGAAGGWDWSHRFWEDAYNSAAQGVKHQGEGTSSSSDSDSSSESDGEAPTRVRKGGCRPLPKPSQTTQTFKSKSKKVVTHPKSDSSSDSDSDVDPKGNVGGAQQHRDGTFASHSAAELAISAELAKDPWGRWGGKTGKMARIRRHELEQAELARVRLGSPLAGANPTLAAAGTGAGSKSVRVAGPPAKPRVVITLTLQEHVSFKRAPFVRTPTTGWWGAAYWVSAGVLEGMEEAAEHVSRVRTTFDEDDQANLYMKVHEHQRQGKLGLGQSTRSIAVAGGAWEGSRVTFADGDDPAKQLPGQQPSGMDNTLEDKAAEGSTKKLKKQKRKLTISPEPSQEPVEAKKPKKTVSMASLPPPVVKWLKLATSLIQQAPKRRLKLAKLCTALLEHATDVSEADLSKILHKKAKKQKLVITDKGYVMLPVA
mmetsp:Transcript_10449/g.18236  ORF Transcript_10449/g.18236 Transcript_10449/m.18236 type:complete len:485 (+) Transcript_10449:109-1563(+)